MLSDNVKAWQMNPDGLYSRINTEAPKVNSQELFLSNSSQTSPELQTLFIRTPVKNQPPTSH